MEKSAFLAIEQLGWITNWGQAPSAFQEVALVQRALADSI
jgi:hypothetical protein